MMAPLPPLPSLLRVTAVGSGPSWAGWGCWDGRSSKGLGAPGMLPGLLAGFMLGAERPGADGAEAWYGSGAVAGSDSRSGSEPGKPSSGLS